MIKLKRSIHALSIRLGQNRLAKTLFLVFEMQQLVSNFMTFPDKILCYQSPKKVKRNSCAINDLQNAQKGNVLDSGKHSLYLRRTILGISAAQRLKMERKF